MTTLTLSNTDLQKAIIEYVQLNFPKHVIDSKLTFIHKSSNTSTKYFDTCEVKLEIQLEIKENYEVI